MAQREIFGENGDDIGVYGSAKDGSPSLTKDIALIQNSNYKQGLSGSLIGDNNPLRQDLNAILFTLSTLIKNLGKDGIAGYDPQETYHIGSLVSSGMSVYQSKLNNNINNPLSNTTYWQEFASQTTIVRNGAENGQIYTQYPGQSRPQDVFFDNGEGGQWIDISWAYAGRFMRVEGGLSLPFEGGTQSPALPNATGAVSGADQTIYMDNDGALGAGFNGAFRNSWDQRATIGIGGGVNYQYRAVQFDMNLNRSNPTYGRRNEVAPQNFAIKIWRYCGTASSSQRAFVFDPLNYQYRGQHTVYFDNVGGYDFNPNTMTYTAFDDTQVPPAGQAWFYDRVTDTWAIKAASGVTTDMIVTNPNQIFNTTEEDGLYHNRFNFFFVSSVNRDLSSYKLEYVDNLNRVNIDMVLTKIKPMYTSGVNAYVRVEGDFTTTDAVVSFNAELSSIINDQLQGDVSPIRFTQSAITGLLDSNFLIADANATPKISIVNTQSPISITGNTQIWGCGGYLPILPPNNNFSGLQVTVTAINDNTINLNGSAWGLMYISVGVVEFKMNGQNVILALNTMQPNQG